MSIDRLLKTAAVMAWIGGVLLTVLDSDDGRMISNLAIGGYAAGACLTVIVVMRSCARHTRRAVYRQQHWIDDMESSCAPVVQLMPHRRMDDQVRRPHRTSS